MKRLHRVERKRLVLEFHVYLDGIVVNRYSVVRVMRLDGEFERSGHVIVVREVKILDRGIFETVMKLFGFGYKPCNEKTYSNDKD